VSGGADSVFLLHALRELGLAHCVVHVNHQLRGDDSDADEAFVIDLSRSFGLQVFSLSQPVSQGNIEQEARRARYEYFGSVIEQGHCDAVATGHTLDDQAETVLYRFLKGAGTAGLSGVFPVTNSRIIRPLLDLRRDQIRDWLRLAGLFWREDCTNLDTGFARNWLRLVIMPQIAEHLNPSLPRTLASTAEWAVGEEEYWSAELDRIAPGCLSRSGRAILVDLDSFSRLLAAAQRRLLRRAILNVLGSLRSIDFDHIERIRSMTTTREGSGRIQLPGLDVYRSFDWLRLAPVGMDSGIERDFSVRLASPGLTTVPERSIALKIESVKADDVYNKQVNALDRDKCAGPLELRNWRPGDRIYPKSASGAEKIKTLFQEFRVPLWERRNWPVIASGDTILWTRQFGADRNAAAGPESNTVLLVHEVSDADAEESNHSLRASIEKKRVRDGVLEMSDPGAEVL
jgi:tRNA(Ile)-lysidine synthase